MPRFTAHMPPEFDAAIDDFEQVRLIKDRFSLVAAILPPLWFGFNRMWLELLGYFGIAVILSFVTYLLGGEVTNWLLPLIGLLIGFEAAELKRRSLTRRHFISVASIYANDPREAAEKLYDLMSAARPKKRALTVESEDAG